MKITFGFPTISDPNAWMTLNAFRAMHQDLECEIVIVDNSRPGCPISDEFAKHVRSNHRDVNYVRDPGPPSSCLYKSRVFENATGDVVICVDSHVLLPAGTVDAVVRFYAENPDSKDLLTGPCMASALKVVATNQHLFADEPYEVPQDATVRHGYVCRGGQLGTWVKDERGLDASGDPFVIRMNGTGFLAMRRAAWPGFPANLWGFGGCEPALYRRVENAGGRVLCHPGARWIHNFSNAHGRGDSPHAVDKVRNYLTIADSLGDANLRNATLEHFKTLHPTAIEPAKKEAQQIAAGTFKPRPHKAERSKPSKELPPQTPSVYDQYIGPWKEAGGDVGGAIPKPLFVSICHQKPVVKKADGTGKLVRTLEFGCGLSTLGFDRQGTDHTAIEHDAKWIGKVEGMLKNGKVKIVHAPIKDGWYDWQPTYGELFDLILIDGPPGSIGRSGCVEVVAKILAPNGIILIDDTHREAEQEISRQLAERLGLQAKRHTFGKRQFDILKPPPEPLGEGPGTQLTKIFEWYGFPACQQCHALARKMNAWGVEGCEKRVEEIVADILPRAKGWTAAKHKWAAKLFGDKAEDSVLKTIIRRQVETAIHQAKTTTAEVQQQSRNG